MSNSPESRCLPPAELKRRYIEHDYRGAALSNPTESYQRRWTNIKSKKTWLFAKAEGRTLVIKWHAALCPYSTQTTNPTNRYELINFRIREDSWNFANFLSKSWHSTILLRYKYDRVTNIRGIRFESLKYCQEFPTIYKNRLRILHERI